MKAIPRVVLLLSAFIPSSPLRAEPVCNRWPLSAWIGRLRDPSPQKRIEAENALYSLGAEAAPAVPVLCEMFHDNTGAERMRLARILANIGPAAVDPLTRALTDPRPQHRTAAALALGRIGAPAKDAIPSLVKILKDPMIEVRLAAAEALWLVAKDPTGVAALAEGLSAKYIDTRQICACILAEIGSPARAAVPALIKALKDEKRSVEDLHSGYIKQLRFLSSKEEQPLFPLFFGENNGASRPVPALAAEALARIGPDARAAVPALKSLLPRPEKAEDNDALSLDVRVSAALALLTLGVEAELVLPVLIEGLRDPLNRGDDKKAPYLDRDHYHAVLAALEKLGPVAVPALIQALDHKEGSVRAAAAQALFCFRELPKDALPALRRMAESTKSELVQLRAIAALARFGEKLRGDWIDYLSTNIITNESIFGDSDRVSLLITGLQLSKDTTVPFLIKALAAEKVGTRTDAAHMLAKLGPAARSAAPALRHLIKTERHLIKTEQERQPDGTEWPVQAWAAIALINMGEPAAEWVPLLVQAQIACPLVPPPPPGHYSVRKNPNEPISITLVQVAKSKTADVLPTLMETLGVNREADQSVAARLLIRLHNEKAAPVVKALADALVNGEDRLRIEAAMLLEEIGRDAIEAKAALYFALHDPLERVRLRSASALWRQEGKAEVVLPILSEAIKSADGKIDEALGVLEQLGPAGAPCLAEVAALWNDPEHFNPGSIDTFFHIAPNGLTALLDLVERGTPSVRARAVILLGGYGPAAVRPLMRLVERTKGDVRLATVEALASNGETARDALPILRPLLEHGDPRLRLAAALAVWDIGKETKDSLPILLDSLRRREAIDPIRVIVALNNMGDAAKGASPVLQQLLTDENEEVRYRAVVALAFVPDGKRAIPALITMLGGDASSTVRASAARVLGLLASDGTVAKEVVQPLTAALRDDNNSVRLLALTSLASMADKAMPSAKSLIDLLDNDIDLECLFTLLGCYGRSGVPCLNVALGHRRREVRLQAAQTLRQLGPEAEQAVVDLICALQSEDEAVRIEVMKALRAIGPKATEAIYSLRVASEDKDGQIRAAAKEALAAIEKK